MDGGATLCRKRYTSLCGRRNKDISSSLRGKAVGRNRTWREPGCAAKPGRRFGGTDLHRSAFQHGEAAGQATSEDGAGQGWRPHRLRRLALPHGEDCGLADRLRRCLRRLHGLPASAHSGGAAHFDGHGLAVPACRLARSSLLQGDAGRGLRADLLSERDYLGL